MRRAPARPQPAGPRGRLPRRRSPAWLALLAACAAAGAAAAAAGPPGGARGAGAAGTARTDGSGPGPAPATSQRTQRMVDPAGRFLAIKPKVFKDLESIEISDYDRARARNTGELYAMVHMKKDIPSALQPLTFRLVGLQLEFTARTAEGGVTYKFRGRFTRGGYLDRMEASGDVILQGHLEAYLGQELLRQEQLDFKYRRVD